MSEPRIAAPEPIESLWTVKEVMQFLSLKRTAVYDRVHAGDLPHLWIGNRLRFVPAKVRAWVEEKAKQACAPNATVLPIGGRR
jgi:excisionase family DNA binding protein